MEFMSAASSDLPLPSDTQLPPKTARKPRVRTVVIEVTPNNQPLLRSNRGLSERVTEVPNDEDLGLNANSSGVAQPTFPTQLSSSSSLPLPTLSGEGKPRESKGFFARLWDIIRSCFCCGCCSRRPPLQAANVSYSPDTNRNMENGDRQYQMIEL